MIGSLPVLVRVLGEVPALPLHSAGKYVAAAYVVLFALVLIYVAIMAIRLSRIEGALSELLACAREGELTAPEPEGDDAGEGSPGAQERGTPDPESTLA